MTARGAIRIRALDHVVLRVRDLEAMVAFYCGVLGCTLERGPGRMRLAQLRAGASLVDLLEVAAPPVAGRANMDHFCLQVEGWDPGALLAHLGRHGVEHGEIGERYGALGHGPSLYLRDPEGNVVELKAASARANAGRAGSGVTTEGIA